MDTIKCILLLSCWLIPGTSQVLPEIFPGYRVDFNRNKSGIEMQQVEAIERVVLVVRKKALPHTTTRRGITTAITRSKQI